MILNMVSNGVDLNKLLLAIPSKKSMTRYYGFEVDKYEFDDGSSIITLWGVIL
jgi:hypothetical protein